MCLFKFIAFPTTRLILAISIFILLLVLILIVEARRARVWLVDVEEEHKDWQEVVPERKKTA